MDALRLCISPESLLPAQSEHFEGFASIPELFAGPDIYAFDKPLAWSVDITNTGGALLVSGTVEGSAQTTCARCLEEFSFPVKGEIEGYFLVGEAQSEPDSEEADEFEILGKDNIIDLAPLIKAALLLEFPMVALCDEECAGLCPECGANLNEGVCECDARVRTSDEVAGEGADTSEISNKNPFAVLKDYSFD